MVAAALDKHMPAGITHIGLTRIAGRQLLLRLPMLTFSRLISATTRQTMKLIEAGLTKAWLHDGLAANYDCQHRNSSQESGLGGQLAWTGLAAQYQAWCVAKCLVAKKLCSAEAPDVQDGSWKGDMFLIATWSSQDISEVRQHIKTHSQHQIQIQTLKFHIFTIHSGKKEHIHNISIHSQTNGHWAKKTKQKYAMVVTIFGKEYY